MFFYFTLLLCRSNKEWSETENKGKTWSCGTNLRLPFVISVNLNISTDGSVRLHRKVLSLREGPHTALTVQQNGSHFEVFVTLRSCGR